jgi:preprotein translocase subunit SecB
MAESDQSSQERQFAVQRIYVKDMSFESPNAPEIFRGDWKPQNEPLNFNTEISRLGDQTFEVVLTVTVTVKVGDKTAFIAEVHQAGIFVLGGFNDQELGQMLRAYCPNLLFPYVREVISDMVVRGGFPPLLLPHVAFEALYAQQLAQQEAADELGSGEQARPH